MTGNPSDNLKNLKQILAEVTHINRAALVLEWDQETYMPPGGVEGRAGQLSTLLRLSHVKFTTDEVGRLLDSLENETVNEPYDSDLASLVRVTRRDYEQARKVPPDLVAEIASAGAMALPAWQKARKEADFATFAPYLARNIGLCKRLADALGYEGEPYDALLDRSEPGMTTKELTRIFGELKEAIVPLIARIAEHRDAVDDSVLQRRYDSHRQLAYAVDVVKRLGYDFERGRQDISAHPFSIAIGPGDVRITTRVSSNFFNECLFGSIHESGHAMYSQGIAPELDNTGLWKAASPGVDESQSRLWENLVGRGLPFWRHFYPSLSSAFPESLAGVHEVAFYRALNKSEPSFIRVEADEVTYNMHVLLRFEIETALLNGKLKVEEIPQAWNAHVKSYLGLDVPNDSQGALQDIHWSWAEFGIFPGYTIGNLISAQLMEKIRTDIPDLDRQIETGDFAALLAWLRDKIHRHGRKFTPNELLERATGKPLAAAPWIDYVTGKFSTLYGLEALRR